MSRLPDWQISLTQSYASIFCLLILFIVWWISKPISTLPFFGLSSQRNTPASFTVRRAFNTYSNYHALSTVDMMYKRKSFSQLRGRHYVLAREIGYGNKLDLLAKSISVNARVTDAIADLAKLQFPGAKVGSGAWGFDHNAKEMDLGRAREVLKHFVRDWSIDGSEERTRVYKPILDQLKKIPETARKDMHVLVPGAGLGRLAWEISQLGFSTTANELSFYMNLAFRFLLSDKTTRRPNQHSIEPFSHWWSHQKTDGSLFRSITFPDVVPRLDSRLGLEERDFMSISPRDSSRPGKAGYDFVVTLFFLDTSPNLIATIDHIKYVLKPRGQWLNLGPLLYNSTKVELALEQVLHLARLLQFDIDEESRVTIDSEYTADRESMMKWIYHAEFWVAKKKN